MYITACQSVEDVSKDRWSTVRGVIYPIHGRADTPVQSSLLRQVLYLSIRTTELVRGDWLLFTDIVYIVTMNLPQARAGGLDVTPANNVVASWFECAHRTTSPRDQDIFMIMVITFNALQALTASLGETTVVEKTFMDKRGKRDK